MTGNVNHPKHYQSGTGLEAIDVIEAFGLDFRLGSAIKYILRAAKKGRFHEDLRKARWFIDRVLEEAEVVEPLSGMCTVEIEDYEPNMGDF